MASDLSKLIEDSFTNTLNALLAKDAETTQITKAHPEDLRDIEILEVQSNFDFTDFTSVFTYYIPARTSALIFNTMMSVSIEKLALTIDDDTVDAISEFISNTSGSFTTAINGENFEDIGPTKFNISHKEVVDGNSLSDLENTYRFEIDLEGEEVIIFITFDTDIAPYITKIASSIVTPHEIRKVKEEEPDIEEEKNIQTNISNTETIMSNQQNDNKRDKEKKDTTSLKKEGKTMLPKENKIKLLVIGVGSLLALILISFLVLYFVGVFDEEPLPVKKEDLNASATVKKKNTVDIVEYTTLKKIDFKISDIDKNRLNNQLAALTKYKVLNQEELAAQALEEKNRLFELEKEKELLDFSKKNIEEPLFEKKMKDQIKVVDVKTKFEKEMEDTPIKNTPIKSTIIEKNDIIVKENAIDIDQLRYVVSSSLQYTLLKSLVQQTTTKEARISVCHDFDGKTILYIGPFENELLQNKMIELSKIRDQNIDMNSVNITEKEFNIRCTLE